MFKDYSFLLLLFLLGSSLATDRVQAESETGGKSATKPSREADFEAWRSYSDRTDELVFRDKVRPHWIAEDDRYLWYRVNVDRDRFEYAWIDCVTGERRATSNRDELNQWVLEQTGIKGGKNEASLEPRRFAAKSREGTETATIEFTNRLEESLDYYWVMQSGKLKRYGSVKPGESRKVQSFEGHAWLLKNVVGDAVASFVASIHQSVAIIDKRTPRPVWKDTQITKNSESHSPNGKWQVVVKSHNVKLRDIESDNYTELTDVGTQSDGFDQRVWWSPNSQHFVVLRRKRGSNRTISLIDSAPDKSIHAKLIDVPYVKPGDTVERPKLYLFSRDHEWKPQEIDNRKFDNPYAITRLSWQPDSQTFSFLYNERGHQSLRLITVDAATATPQVTINETSATFVCYSSKSFLHYVEASDEWIWMSERSGWNHLYRIDADSGEVVNAITQGPWVVRGVERVDEENQFLYLRASGIDKDQDPYQIQLIRINFDGSDLVRLTEGDGHHRWQFSPHNRYLIDTYSRVDMPPVTCLRDVKSGKLICQLEKTDASKLLASGWQPPERFVTKGRDDMTDIHGIIIRPMHFDPQKSYPVLEEIYAGPHSAFVPKEFGRHQRLYEMAELGFIVVKIDGMGTNHRSKAFHDVCWKNIADSGFPDRIRWIKAAARTRPEMDLNRIGIWGGSAGGQSAMRALIDHGDFYKAAVADCGCHDNRVDKRWWNEQWMGWPVGPHYRQQSNVTGAHRVQGDLMLIWGELDRNVDPACTMQVIDALIKANKDFEQLVMPGVGHGAASHPYAHRRQAEFFVKKLLDR